MGNLMLISLLPMILKIIPLIVQSLIQEQKQFEVPVQGSEALLKPFLCSLSITVQ